MSDKRVFHVRRWDDSYWQVIREGFSRPHVIRNTRDEAITLAKRLAKTIPPGQVVIHDGDDVIERRLNFYPAPIPVAEQLADA